MTSIELQIFLFKQDIRDFGSIVNVSLYKKEKGNGVGSGSLIKTFHKTCNAPSRIKTIKSITFMSG